MDARAILLLAALAGLPAPLHAGDKAQPAAPPKVAADPAPGEETPARRVPEEGSGLPKAFVHLSQVDASILQDMRYAGPFNFTGARVPGYNAPSCILAEPVARALAKVQGDLKPQGLTLVMLDCYRPAMAVKAMVAAMARRKGTDAQYHPAVPASQLVAQGYLASRSGHSSGGSVDLTLARIGANGSHDPLDMGTRFDFFDRKSHTAAKGLTAAARANRQTLVKAMQARGFANYSREWWHFKFAAEPFAGRHFNFPVSAAPQAPKS